MLLLVAFPLALGAGSAAPVAPCHLEPGAWQLVLEADAVLARPGERVKLHWSKTDGRHGSYMPRECLADWQVSDPRLASLSLDRYSITIAPEAPPGSVVTVSTRFGDKRTSLEIRVLAPDEPVLAGVWQRVSDDRCNRAPAELWFGMNGRFSYTFPEQILETMQSGSGDYSWEWRTGAIQVGALKARAERRGDTLITRGIEFSALDRAETSACAITWRAVPQQLSRP